MSIIRAPRPARGFTIVSNQIAQRRDMSRRAKGLLVELLSHTDGWRTDSNSLAEAGPEGRDAIRTTLKELETFGYLVRLKHQDRGGRWRTDSFIFDEPVPPGFDPASLLAGPGNDPDEFSTGDQPRDELDGDQPEALFDQTAFTQVAPETDSQASVPPTTGNPASVDPTVGFPGANNKTSEHTHVAGVVPYVQTAGPTAGDAPLDAPQAMATASPGRPADRDEHGPLVANCPEHPTGTAAACTRCGQWREAFEAAEIKRAAARRRALSAAEFERERAERQHALDAAENARRVAESREIVRQAKEAAAARAAAQDAPGGTS